MKNYRKALKTDIPCIKCKWARKRSFAKEVKVKRLRCYRLPEWDYPCSALKTCDNAAIKEV